MIKRISVIIFITIFGASVVYAIAWPLLGVVAYQTALRYATSAGFRNLIVRTTVSNAAIKAAVKAAMSGGPSKLSWKIIAGGAATGSTLYMVLDLAGLVNNVEQEPDSTEFVERIVTLDNGDSLSVSAYHTYSQHGQAPTGHNLRIWIKDGRIAVSRTTTGVSKSEGTKYFTYTVTKNGVPSSTNVLCYRYEHTVTITDDTGGGRVVSDNTVTVVNSAVVDQYIDDHYDEVAALPVVITATPPSVSVSMGNVGASVTEEPLVDTQTGAVTDTRTMLDQRAQVDPTLGTFTPPPQPGDPSFDDSGYVLPEIKTFEEVMQPYSDGGDVVGDFLRDFTISGTGAGQVSIPLPFGDGSAVLDFGQFDDLYAQLRIIIIGFAYLFGIMIFFKGS